MKGKWIEFKVIEEKKKTKVYEVFETRSGDMIGSIYWWGRWRQYVFEPDEGTIWSWDCLKAISDFIKELMEERKRK